MSIDAIQWAWQQNVTPTEMLVLVCLADFSNKEEGFVAWPGQNLIAQRTKLYPTTVSKVLKRLERAGLVVIQRRKFQGVQRSSRYTLPVASGASTGCPTSKSLVAPPATYIEPLKGTVKEPLLLGKPKMEDQDMAKGFGQKDVDDTLKAAEEKEPKSLDEVIGSLKKHGTRYPVAELRRLYVYLWKENGYGFLKEWTVTKKDDFPSQVGQVNLFQKTIAPHDPVPVLVACLSDWNAFTEYTEAFSRPSKPHVGFLLKYADAAVNFTESVHLSAQTEEAQKAPWAS